MYKKLCFAVIFITLMSFVFKTFFEDIKAKLLVYQTGYLQEKVYLHTDKPYYIAGDRLLFTAYLQNTSLNVADSLSKILYVELCNSDKKIVQNIILEISENVALGDFKLPDSLKGNYFLRAYTQYMRNFGEETFFTKSLVIGEQFANTNKITNKDTENTENITQIAAIKPNYEVKFYPEGGDLVNSLRSNVAFELSGTYDNSQIVKGILCNLAGKTLQTLQTSHEGKGIFKHTPLAGQEYLAKFVLANGDSIISKLPKAQETGFVLSLNEINDSIKIKVYSNYLESKQFYLIGQQQGDVFCEATGNLQKGSYSIALAKQNLPQGIAQITLFDQTGKPHCERLFFVNQQDFLNIKLTTDKKNYKPKEKVNAEITVTDKAGQAMEGIFSVSVTDADLVKYNKFSENINSYFSLSSELEKYTSQASYYLQNNEEAKKNLDLLLLTNGWRRYKWKDILDNPMPKRQYSVEQSFYLSGKITNQSERKSLAKSTITVLVGSKPYATEADSLGKFDLNIGTWKDSTKVIVQSRNKKGNQYVKLTLDKQDTPNIEQVPFDLFPSKNNWHDKNSMKIFAEKSRQSQALESNFRMINGIIQLNEVIVEAKKTPEEKVEEKIRKMSLHKNYTRKIDGKDLPDIYMHPLEALQGRVISLQVLKDEYDMVTGILNRDSGVISMYLLDGLPVTIQALMGLSMSNIERIEIMQTPQAIYGFDGLKGAIAVYTKAATNESYSSYENPGLSKRMMTGFYQAKEFYMPNYEQKDLQLNTPDVRVTVYWNGKIKTDKNGKAKFSFFCAENAKKYDVNIEGKAKNNQLTGVANSEITLK